jgi:hypothetical protein
MPDHPADAASRALVVGAHQRPRAGQAVSTYTRMIYQQEVTVTCVECGRTRTQLQYPGGRPRYCNMLCADAAKRRLAAERKRRQRVRQQVLLHSGAGS